MRREVKLRDAEKACELNHGPSCELLSALLHDPVRTTPLLWKARHLGEKQACFDLEHRYLMGVEREECCPHAPETLAS
jgi:hypothetical protein